MNPTFASTASAQTHQTAPTFSDLGLHQQLLSAIEDLGFSTPTPVQQKAIVKAMAQPLLDTENTSQDDDSSKFNRFFDLIVCSQTGSGKTAAFLLPVLHELIAIQSRKLAQETLAWQEKIEQAQARGEALPKRPKRKNPTSSRNFQTVAPQALVLCPTRELAQQVANDAIDLVKHSKGIRVASVVGGMPYQMQLAKLQNANLVVATPGRLLDLYRSKQIKLEQVQFLILDEADRMLDLGFSDDLTQIHMLTSQRLQTLLFSATFAMRTQQLIHTVLNKPVRIDIDSPQNRHANITQNLYWADNDNHKRQLLDHWLRESSIDQAIVFANTQIECDALANDLQQCGFSAVALHGALSQSLRNRRLQALRKGQVKFLIATDVAARGIDVPTISHVFNYGLPMKAEDYTHRIGRTGRAGRNGLAITFAQMRDRRRINDIEAFNRQPFSIQTIAGLEPTATFKSHKGRTTNPSFHQPSSHRRKQKGLKQNSHSSSYAQATHGTTSSRTASPSRGHLATIKKSEKIAKSPAKYNSNPNLSHDTPTLAKNHLRDSFASPKHNRSASKPSGGKALRPTSVSNKPRTPKKTVRIFTPR